MKRGAINNVSGAKRLLNQLAAQKKKAVIAAGLIGIMFFMWGRVLVRQGAKGAAGMFTTQAAAGGESDLEVKISYKELPKVPGRNDVLSRDFFDGDNWLDFIKYREGGNSSGSKEVNIVSGDGSEEIAMKVAEKLKLQAIELGGNPQAFINDRLLSAGDKLVVGERDSKYECEVVRIEENTVFLRCGDAEIRLKLIEMEEVVD